MASARLAACEKDDAAILHPGGGTTRLAWISDLRMLTTRKDGPVQAIRFLRSKGVVVLIVPRVEHTHLDGAEMLLDRTAPVVALTLRHDRRDSFRFVLFHELGHIFLHRDRGLEFGFFDEDPKLTLDEIEIEADEFAQRALISEAAWTSSFARSTTSAKEILTFAKRFQIDPSIVAGRIRRERDNYKIFTELVGAGVVPKAIEDAGLVGEIGC